MPLHHSSFNCTQQIEPKTASHPKPQKMELDKRIIMHIADEMRERDEKLAELQYINEQMKIEYEDHIAILKALATKNTANEAAETIKSLIETKQNEIIQLQQERQDNVIATEAELSEAQRALEEKLPELVKPKKNERPVMNAGKKQKDIKQIAGRWK